MNSIGTASESKMLFYLERTGGFAGKRMTVTLNTESLPLEDARKLHQMVEDADFFSLPEKLLEPNTGADIFIYKLAVEKFGVSFPEGKKHTVRVDQLNIPENLQPLIQALETHTIPEDKSKIVTMSDNGKTITLNVNETFALNLGVKHDWKITIDDLKIVSRDPLGIHKPDIQGIYKANKEGHTKLTAIGEPVCRKEKPPCKEPTRKFSIQILVTEKAELEVNLKLGVDVLWVNKMPSPDTPRRQSMDLILLVKWPHSGNWEGVCPTSQIYDFFIELEGKIIWKWSLELFSR